MRVFFSLLLLGSLLSAPAFADDVSSSTVSPQIAKLIAEPVLGPAMHSPARDQGDAGFCWSYTLSGLMEGEALKQGKEVTLSPEYLALNHIFYFIEHNGMIPMFQEMDNSHGIAAWFERKLAKVLFSRMFDSTEGTANFTKALHELNEIGIMPETNFYYKVPAKEPHPTLSDKLDAFSANFFDKQKIAAYAADPELLRSDLAKAIGIHIPKPTDTFPYQGKIYTPVTFMKEYLEFDPQNYVEATIVNGKFKPVQKSVLDPKTGKVVDVDDPDSIPYLGLDEDKALAIVRAAVQDNVSVPISFAVLSDQKKAQDIGVFATQDCGGKCGLNGYHAVLAIGLKQDTSQSVGSMASIGAVLIKNSWGQIGLTEKGESSKDKTQLGYFLITPDYLAQGQSKNGWSFLVPKKYLAGPTNF